MRRIKHLCIVLILLLLCYNVQAAIVSDNDGSAFITKAEFDALKSSFNEQINSYNESIDSKIDGAIASYLAGISLATTEMRKIVDYQPDILCMDNANPLIYEPGYSYVTGMTGQTIFQDTDQSGDLDKGSQTRQFYVGGNSSYWSGDTNPNPYKKLLISDIDITDASNKIAKWVGYGTDGREHLALKSGTSLGGSGWNAIGATDDTSVGTLPGTVVIAIHETQVYDNSYNINGNSWSSFNSKGYFFRKGWSPGDLKTYGYGHQGFVYIQSLSINNPKIQNSNLFIFANQTEPEFQSSQVVTGTPYCSYAATTGGSLAPLKTYGSKAMMSGDDFLDWMNNSFSNMKSCFTQVKISDLRINNYTKPASWDYGYKEPTGYLFGPLVQGFEYTHINEWKQVYNPSYDSLASTYTTSSIPNAVLTGGDGKKHMALTAGFPLVDAKKGEEVTFIVDEKGTFKPLYLWVKTVPFDITAAPYNETDKSKFLTISGNNGATFDNTSKALKITANNTDVKILIPETESNCYLWLKWGLVPASGNVTDCKGGGELKLTDTVSVKLPR